jgi:hypothetical protein
MDARKLVFDLCSGYYSYADNVTALRQSRALQYIPATQFKVEEWIPVSFDNWGYE